MRLAIITDIHEDHANLQKVLKSIDRTGCDKLICLGDISGYSEQFYSYKRSRNASACLELVRERCDIVIPGNHDLHAAGRIPEHSAIFDFPPGWYDMAPRQQSEQTNDELWLHADDLNPGYSDADIAFLTSLPEYAILNTPGINILLSHYAYPNLSGFKKGFYSWEREFGPHFEFMQRNNPFTAGRNQAYLSAQCD